MKKETEITLAAAGAVGTKYDEACKELFQNKEIIAPVLKCRYLTICREYFNVTGQRLRSILTLRIMKWY